MRDKIKERLQCRDCKMPYCDALCTDLSDEQIDWIMCLTKQEVIKELERTYKHGNVFDRLTKLKEEICEIK